MLSIPLSIVKLHPLTHLFFLLHVGYKVTGETDDSVL